jgi:hypothetical protein
MSLWTNRDEEAGKPKYILAADKSKVYGVSNQEAGVASNKAKGLKTPGWTKYTTYTDANGTVRHKSEVLVTLNDMVGDAPDATPTGTADDAVVADV